LFFACKGGVGKSSVSTAFSIALAGSGKRDLLVSTHAASTTLRRAIPDGCNPLINA